MDARRTALRRHRLVNFADHIIHQQIRRIAGMVSKAFDLHDVAGVDVKDRVDRTVERAPLNGFESSLQIVKLRSGRAFDHGLEHEIESPCVQNTKVT
ncbi:Uncharacterised protein [Mycobacterium tuberculosis]|nr:Uncharacterised protein [Mycobacterium tuberculosis]